MDPRITMADPYWLKLAVSKFMDAGAGEVYSEAPGTLTFVASAGTTIYGWAWGYHLVRPDDSSMLYLHQIEVDESHRRKGIGRELLRAFMATGAAAGATKMFLTTGADNFAARSLYEAMGGGLASQGPTVNYWFRLSG
ncbi:GNAT family N-acetyltransferase [Phytoactinopolyspora alkaliphila]|uniref:GNAT family N-acetyltransferase n=1 Tax=Phytoactinopolyspora alkaliphila TaxID=1783498 RepID=A0A6N9YGW1_9ACTN|nr:GNAT family N-acetyltransferase [Phytoactinopolyspora alkaliphila]NED94170.1 GNAT family N-acetyltransferase [Phytoactinopolyspora alkaliphila]